MTDSPSPYTAMLRRLTELGSSYEFRPATGVVWTASECFLGVEDPESAAGTMIEEFGADALLNYRILEEQEDAAPRISAEYWQSSGPMIALSSSESNPFQLMTRRNTFNTAPAWLVNVLHDANTLERLKKRRGILVLTQTVGQAAVLRNLGIAAAPAGRWQNLNFQQLKALAAMLRRTRKQFKNVQDVEFTLVLANWHPGGSTDEQQLSVRDLAQFVTRAVRTLTIDFGDVAVWDPTLAEQDECEFVIRMADAETLWWTVYGSIESSSYAVEVFGGAGTERRQHPENWRQALQRVRGMIDQELRDGEANPELGESLELLSELVDQDLVEPIIDLAERSRDPLQKSLLAHAAETTRTLQLQSPGIHRLLSSLAAGGDSTTKAELIKQLSQRHRTVCDLLQLIKVIRK